MDPLTVLKLSIDKVLEVSKKQDEKLADIQKKVEHTSTSVALLARRVDRIEESSSSGSIKVPRELSAKVKGLHGATKLQFNGDDNFNSPHNDSVAKFLEQQLQGRFEDKYSYRQIHRAVYRYYESRRRNINDSKPERFAQVTKNKEWTRKYGKKRRVYIQRSKQVKRSEQKYWEKVPIDAMSSEEEDGDGNIYRHKPSWRSDALDTLIEKLDDRTKKKRAPKVVKLRGSPSNHPAPNGISKWMVNSSNDVLSTSPQEHQGTATNSSEQLTVNQYSTLPPVSESQVTTPNGDSWETFQDFSQLASQLEAGIHIPIVTAYTEQPQSGTSTPNEELRVAESSTSTSSGGSHSTPLRRPFTLPPSRVTDKLCDSDYSDDSDSSFGVIEYEN